MGNTPITNPIFVVNRSGQTLLVSLNAYDNAGELLNSSPNNVVSNGGCFDYLQAKIVQANSYDVNIVDAKGNTIYSGNFTDAHTFLVLQNGQVIEDPTDCNVTDNGGQCSISGTCSSTSASRATGTSTNGWAIIIVIVIAIVLALIASRC